MSYTITGRFNWSFQKRNTSKKEIYMILVIYFLIQMKGWVSREHELYLRLLCFKDVELRNEIPRINVFFEMYF
jgi:hypothetical protein